MTQHRSIGEIIEVVERPVYYVVLTAYFAVTLGSEITGIQWHWLEAIRNVLFPAVIIAIFRYFDRLVRSPRELSEFGDELGAAVSEAVKGCKPGITLELLAFTTSKYFVLIKDAGIQIGRMRVFVPSDAAIKQTTLLRPEIREVLLHEKARAVQNWRSLQRTGRINNLEFVEVPFVPLFHLLLVEKQSVVFGFFKTSTIGDSFNTMTKFLARSGEGVGSAFVKDCADLLIALENLGATKVQKFSSTWRNDA